MKQKNSKKIQFKSEQNGLPVGWEWSRLGDCVKFLDSQRVPLNSTERAKRKGSYPYYGANGKVDSIDDYIYDEPLTLLAEDGGFFDNPLRGVAYCVDGKCWVNNHAHVLKPLGGISNKYIRNALNCTDLLPFVSGTTRLKLNQGAAQKVNIALAPLTEQNRILNKLEKLFNRVEKSNTSIEKVPGMLRQFRQAVLAAACSGKLVEQDPSDEPASILLERIRAQRKKKWHDELIAKRKDLKDFQYREPGKPNTSELPELPEGWAWTTTEMLASNQQHSFTDGPFGSNLKTADYVAEGARVIRLQNIGVAAFKNDKKAFVSMNKFVMLQKHEAKSGDLIISALADPVGRCCMVPKGLGKAIVKADCVRLRVNPAVAVSRYVMFALNTHEHFKRAEDASHGVGRARANFSDIKSFVVPLPPYAEQQRIIAKIEELFALADTIEASVTKAQRNAERIKQALLAKAFRGELVEQDPNDEPASVLLRRIKENRSASVKAKS